MKKIILLSLFFILLVSCNSSVNGEGIATAQKEYKVDKIDNLTISCNCNVILVPGNTTNLRIDSHQNLIDNLDITTNKNSLSIKEKKDVKDFSSYDVYVYVTRDFKKFIIDKKTSVTTSGALNVDELEIIAKDQSKISQTYLITDKLDLRSEDHSSILLEGTTEKMKIKAENNSKLNLFKFEVNEVDFLAEDNALLDVNARQILSGSAKNNTIVSFIGDPNKELKITDQAQVLKK